MGFFNRFFREEKIFSGFEGGVGKSTSKGCNGISETLGIWVVTLSVFFFTIISFTKIEPIA